MSAPKQLAKRQKLERKRLRKREMRLKRERKQQARWCESGYSEPIAALSGPVGGVKMSEVLMEFVAPLRDDTGDRADYARLLSLGLIAWNAALQPEDRREAMIDDLLKKGLRWESLWERHVCRELVDTLLARKLKSFANYQRPILAFHLEELEDGGYYVSVVSGLFC